MQPTINRSGNAGQINSIPKPRAAECSPIGRQMEGLCENISNLESRMTLLVQKLGPVLTPEPCGPEGHPVAQDGPSVSNVAGHLAQQNARLERLGVGMEALTRLIEI